MCLLPRSQAKTVSNHTMRFLTGADNRLPPPYKAPFSISTAINLFQRRLVNQVGRPLAAPSLKTITNSLEGFYLVVVLLGLQLAGLQSLEHELARGDVVVVVLQALAEVLLVHVAGVDRRLLVGLGRLASRQTQGSQVIETHGCTGKLPRKR